MASPDTAATVSVLAPTVMTSPAVRLPPYCFTLAFGARKKPPPPVATLKVVPVPLPRAEVIGPAMPLAADAAPNVNLRLSYATNRGLTFDAGWACSVQGALNVGMVTGEKARL